LKKNYSKSAFKTAFIPGSYLAIASVWKFDSDITTMDEMRYKRLHCRYNA